MDPKRNCRFLQIIAGFSRFLAAEIFLVCPFWLQCETVFGSAGDGRNALPSYPLPLGLGSTALTIFDSCSSTRDSRLAGPSLALWALMFIEAPLAPVD